MQSCNLESLFIQDVLFTTEFCASDSDKENTVMFTYSTACLTNSCHYTVLLFFITLVGCLLWASGLTCLSIVHRWMAVVAIVATQQTIIIIGS